MIKPIFKILDEVQELKTKKEKVNFLKAHNSIALRNVLALMYGKNLYTIMIPDELPQFTENKDWTEKTPNNALYRESKKLKYIVKESSGNISQYNRERIFINMLESIDPRDVVYIEKAIKQEPIQGLSKQVIREALGNIV